ncbi:amino acid adenylation domain-containing protein [Kitasatospora sp. NBC_00070]|uniref:amino acid adenylation domain-containing protein n=1 Tax=Kitasatospora sp. NBC_00070 TaxID=2975962 RepID=UPI003248E9D9
MHVSTGGNVYATGHPVTLINQVEAERIAVVDGAHSYSYGRLRADAEALSAQLIATGSGRGDLIALHARRGYGAVVAMLAVLSVEAGYVVVDPNLPQVRRERILRTARPVLELHPSDGCAQWTQTPSAFAPEPAASGGVTPRPAAYLVFTSGSTGEPKGVRVSHDSLAWHSRAAGAVYTLDSEDRVLHSTSLTFDVAAEELWPTLARGATVVVLASALGEYDYDRFTRFLTETEVTVANLPASYVAGWARQLAAQPAPPPALRLVVAGSEVVQLETARTWLQGSTRHIDLFNAYGVSEATVTSIAGRLTEDVLGEGGTAPIGVPLSEVTVRVLAENGAEAGAGDVGELLIGGPGVADGYQGDPALTDARFSTTEDGTRWYRTGDLVRHRDGALVFVGRMDEQLKIGGHRIEPGEIAAAIVEVSAAQDARVLRIDGELTACTLGSTGLLQGALCDALAQRLPSYMLPTAFLALESFPMTTSGKVDQTALRAQAEATLRARAEATGQAEAAARSSADEPTFGLEALLGICRDLLGRPELDGTADFFEAGGTSLAAARLVAAVFRQHQLVVPIDAVFAHPRLEALAQHLTELSRG